jgi:hypothetical protein
MVTYIVALLVVSNSKDVPSLDVFDFANALSTVRVSLTSPASSAVRL